jgi:hypothetical protein
MEKIIRDKIEKQNELRKMIKKIVIKITRTEIG